jgi:chemotaxis protein MotB
VSFRLSCTLLLALGGCGVTQAEYNIKTTELEKCQAEQSRAQVELGAAQARLEDKSHDLERRDEEIARMEGEARTLARNLSATEREMDALRRARATSEQRSELYRSLLTRLKEPIGAGLVAVDVRKGKMLVRLGEELLFDSGQAQLKPSGQQALKQVALALKDIPDRDFLVAGHTDNKPLLKGSPYASNWDLSAARAVTVVRFLQSEGVDPRHLAAAGYSEFDTLDDNGGAGDPRARNRRIEVVIQPRADELPAIDVSEPAAASPTATASPSPTPAAAPAAAPAAPATGSPPRPAAPTP